MDPQVRARVMAAAEAWPQPVRELVEISLPHTEYAVAIYYMIATGRGLRQISRALMVSATGTAPRTPPTCWTNSITAPARKDSARK
ncbi:MAG: hypothetical protein QM755_10065 [Luteolibacter sp.]